MKPHTHAGRLSASHSTSSFRFQRQQLCAKIDIYQKHLSVLHEIIDAKTREMWVPLPLPHAYSLTSFSSDVWRSTVQQHLVSTNVDLILKHACKPISPLALYKAVFLQKGFKSVHLRNIPPSKALTNTCVLGMHVQRVAHHRCCSRDLVSILLDTADGRQSTVCKQ